MISARTIAGIRFSSMPPFYLVSVIIENLEKFHHAVISSKYSCSSCRPASEELVTDSQGMKKLAVTFCAMAALASAAYAGPEYSGKETKQVAPPPCPQWYADNEFNVSLWGTYLFTGTDSANDRYV